MPPTTAPVKGKLAYAKYLLSRMREDLRILRREISRREKAFRLQGRTVRELEREFQTPEAIR